MVQRLFVWPFFLTRQFSLICYKFFTVQCVSVCMIELSFWTMNVFFFCGRRFVCLFVCYERDCFADFFFFSSFVLFSLFLKILLNDNEPHYESKTTTALLFHFCRFIIFFHPCGILSFLTLLSVFIHKHRHQHDFFPLPVVFKLLSSLYLSRQDRRQLLLKLQITVTW